MKRTFFILVMLLTVINLYAQKDEFIADELIVRFTKTTPQNEIKEFLDNHDFDIIKKFSIIDNSFLIRRKGVTKKQVMQSFGSSALSTTATQLQASPLTEIVEPNYMYYASQTTPDDAQFNSQWAMHNTGQTGGTNDADIDAPEAWDTSTGTEVIVGIIDTGIDYNHQELSSNIWTNPNEIANNGIDDDNNGYVDDIHGWDFVNNDNDPYDDNGHGTHCAGIIGAIGNNGTGIAGINWQAKIVPLKFLNSGGGGSSSAAIEAVTYAASMGIPVTNNSWGGSSYSELLYQAIASAGEQGMLFVASAGNDAVDTDTYNAYPAAYDLDNIISVAATDYNDNLAYFSNYGKQSVDLGAPGVEILSTLPGNYYAAMDGTSMAGPHVTGAASMLLGLNQNLSIAGIKDILLTSTDPVASLENKTVSGGRLNLYNALQLVEPDTVAPDPVSDLSIVYAAANWITLSLTATGDDQNTGLANKYDIRYSNTIINESNFDQATQLQPQPKPGEPGSVDSIKVTNLNILTTYYFAVKVIDEQKNSSVISNVISATTQDEIPNLFVYNDSLYFRETVIGATDTIRLHVLNTGLQDLLISQVNVNETVFSIYPTFASIDANESQIFEIYFSPQVVGDVSATLTFLSNDPSDPTLDIFLTGTGANAPLISITPDSLREDIPMGQTSVRAINLQNSGQGQLDYQIAINYSQGARVLETSPLFVSEKIIFPEDSENSYTVGQTPAGSLYRSNQITSKENEAITAADDEQLSLENVLEDLNNNFQDITETIPDHYNFTDGVNGYYIANGGQNMYDYGNYLYTNLNSRIYYSDNTIVNEPGFGSSGRYFTKKYEGLFVLAADISNLDYFAIDGNLGNYDYGNVNGSVLYTSINGAGYYGYVKRVYNGGTPSVNHLIIIPENPEVQHSFPSSSYYDYHYITNLHNTTRIYYLLYAGSNGSFIDDEATLDIMNTFLSIVSPNRDWLSAAPGSGSIDPGANDNLQVTMNAADLKADEYHATILISSNDPLNNHINIPVDISVSGAPVFSVKSDTLDFGNIFVGNADTLELVVSNEGTEDLLISNIDVTSNVFSVSPAFAGIDPGEDETFYIIASSAANAEYSATLTFYSNSAEGSNQIQLLCNVVYPPVADITPDSLNNALYSGDQTTSQISISNSGQSNLIWNMAFDFSENASVLVKGTAVTNPDIDEKLPFNENDVRLTERNDIEQMSLPVNIPPNNTQSDFDELPVILNNLNENYQDVIDIIPSRYDFSDGISGYYILDGGDDMYDGGNYLMTNFGNYINYSDNMIQQSPLLGNSGKYFTRKYPGLFVLAADLDNISSFYIDGNLGGYSSSITEGTIFEARVRGIDYYGFLKRVYNTGYKPSVYHLIIIPANPEVSQTFSTSYYSDNHQILNLNNTSRMYYLLFAGSNGALIDDNAVLNIMKTFISALEITPEWISVSADSGNVQASATENVAVTFHATNLDAGYYSSNINIATNDPFNSTWTIPAHLEVTGASDIDLSADSIDFGNTFLTGRDSVNILIENSGSKVLAITDISSDNNAFSVNKTIFALNPGDIDTLSVYFAPLELQFYSGSLTLYCNDPDEGQKIITVQGNGALPPNIELSRTEISDTLNAGKSASYPINISNSGSSDLIWNAIANYTATSSVLNQSMLFPGKNSLKNRLNNKESKDAEQEEYKSDAILSSELNTLANDWQNQEELALEEVLSKLNQNVNNVTSLIPNRYNFSDGQSGYYIYDGGNNMYNSGNYLRTSNGGYINYTNNSLSSSSYFGGSGLYFTAKYNGLFVLAADLENLNYFLIDGSLGASGLGTVDGAVLSTSYGKTYLGFVKRVYNSGSVPSVNHLIIIEYDASVIHEFYTNTYDDYHTIQNINNVKRIYYLLYASQNGGYIDNDQTLAIMKAFLAAIGLVPEWLTLDTNSGVIAPGESTQINAQVNTIELHPDLYEAGITISSNDPQDNLIEIPVSINVNSSPKIYINPDSLVFSKGIIGNKDTLFLPVSNIGTDLLNISGINSNNSVFTTASFPPVLNINQTEKLPVIFSPVDTGYYSGILEITSNDPDLPVAQVKLTGQGLLAPDITLSPDSVYKMIASGNNDSSQIAITNNGNSDLDIFLSLDYSESASVLMKSPVFASNQLQYVAKDETYNNTPQVDPADIYSFSADYIPKGDNALNSIDQPTLEEILAELNDNYQNINSLIPSRFDFSNGESGYYISDGGSDMYDGGNYLMTNLGGNILYSNKMINNNNYLGPNSRYFTAKYPGLFILSADINNIDYFLIDGGLGADGYGNVDGAILETNMQGSKYTAFVKRVYNAGKPTVNHLIIIPKNNSANHDFSTNTDSDYHRIYNLSQTKRLYYLLYSSSNGGYIDNDQTLDIMKAFLNTIGVTPGWLSVAPDSSTVNPGNTLNTILSFMADNLSGGRYNSHLMISTNIPGKRIIKVPVIMDVTGIPDIAVSDNILDFKKVFIGLSDTLQVTVKNEGTDILNVSSITSDKEVYTVDKNNFSLSPEDTTILKLIFTPQTQQGVLGQINIESNDPDEATYTIYLQGTGQLAPEIEVSPVAIADTLNLNEISSHIIQLSNTGGNILKWDAYASDETVSSILYHSPVFSPAINKEEREDRDRKSAIVKKDKFIDFSNFYQLTNNIKNIESDAHAGAPALSDVLEDFIDNYTNITDIIPERFNFSDGVDGNYIFDGGNDMYDYGNYLRTNIGGNINYSNNLITNNAYLGNSGQYFTSKVPGLFIFCADISNLDYFEISGSLGTGGNGMVDGSVIQTELQGQRYTGFVKRVYGASEPSVNHLIIIPDATVQNQIFATSVYSDYHQIYNLNSTKRIYYLLYASTNGTYIDDNETLHIMNEFLKVVLPYPDWITLSPEKGELAQNESISLSVTMDSEAAGSGKHNTNIIISSNAVNDNHYIIPVAMTVKGSGNLSVSADTINFGVLYNVTSPVKYNLGLYNTGDDSLYINTIVSSSNVFQVNKNGGLQIAPMDSETVTVTFTAPDSGTFMAHLEIASNESETPLMIPVEAINAYTALISTQVDSFNFEMEIGDTSTLSFNLENKGLSDLDWNISATKFYADSIPYNMLNYIQQHPELNFSELFGVNVGINTFFNLQGYDIFESDLNAQQALLWNIIEYETELMLDSLDILITNTGFLTDTMFSVNALKQWVENSNTLILQGTSSNNEPIVNSLLNGSHITAIYSEQPTNSVINNISDHPSTANVDTIIYAPYNFTFSVSGPAVVLAYDGMNKIFAAVSELGKGKIVVLGREIFTDQYKMDGQNRLFCNQLIRWLADYEKGIFFTPRHGIIAAGASEQIDIKIKTSAQSTGDYTAAFFINSNDPLNPQMRNYIQVLFNPVTGLFDILSKQMPQAFELKQNYPNPFNPLTKIVYGIPKPSKVKINVYNIQGQLIETLYNGFRQAGYYQVEFNAHNYASGLYIYKIEAANFIAVKKMILIK